MASEYLKKLAQDVKPEPKRELTPREKRINWWHYHKWHVVIVLVVIVALISMIRDIAYNKSNLPDYQVACVGTNGLPEDTAEALSAALAELGEDLNGDGQVLVQINQYLVDSEEFGMAARVQLMADVSEGFSFVYLLEDPAAFQEQYGVLAYPDGTILEEGTEPSGDLWLSWSDCPVLTQLPLGSYTLSGVDQEVIGDSQALMSQLYIARRGVGESSKFDDLEGCIALWQKLTQGANEN